MSNRRVCIPTLHSAWRSIEQYQESVQPDVAARLESTLSPLDAMLFHLLLELLPGDASVVDLAAEAMGGACSVLALGQSRVRRVAIPETSGSNRLDNESRLAVERFRQTNRSEATVEMLPVGRDPHSALVGGPQDAVRVLLLAADDAETRAGQVRACLEAAPEAVVGILGLGRVGDCQAIEVLLRDFGTGSGYRLHLLRERGAALVASRFGLIARSGHPVEETLHRIEQLYATNLDFLDFLKDRNLHAIKAAADVPSTIPPHPLLRTLESQIAGLTQALKDAESQCERTRVLEASLSFKVAGFVQRVRQRLAPDGSLRYRVLLKVRRAVFVLRTQGPLVLVKRVTRKLIGPRM
ncbi:MAG: hypothetical protein K2R98_11435 [Gemmataceae bacterium]|nr:hypothetical protein [Gemmataceae bacterium]